MANCYKCGGYLLSKDKHTVHKKEFHKNCWGRLDRKQQEVFKQGKELEKEKEYKVFPLDNFSVFEMWKEGCDEKRK